jgi:hypothetical protein
MLLGLVLCTFTACSKPHPKPIIDMHLHAYTIDWSGGRLLANPMTGQAPVARNDAQLIQVTLDIMDRYNIVKAVASGPLEGVRRWKAVAPDRIIGAVMFTGAESSYTPTPELLEIKKAYNDGQIGAIGELASQYAGLSPDAPELEPFFEIADQLKIPVGIHMGTAGGHAAYRCCPGYRMALGNPLLLEDVLVKYPRLRVYVMHAGWPFLDEMMALFAGHPQVYADLSAINWSLPEPEFERYVRQLVEAGYGKRLMFGSDQMIWPELIEVAIKRIEEADFLTTEQKRDIFYNNAARFLYMD